MFQFPFIASQTLLAIHSAQDVRPTDENDEDGTEERTGHGKSIEGRPGQWHPRSLAFLIPLPGATNVAVIKSKVKNSASISD